MNTERISIPAAIFRTGRALVLAAVLTVGLTGLLRAEVLTSVLATNLFEPYGLVVSENNRIFVADSANNRIVRYNQASGVVEEFAGRRGADNKGAVDSAGTLARFYGPQGLVMSRDLLIVADTANNLIRTITTNGVVATVAGSLGLAALSHELGAEPDNFGSSDGGLGVGQLHAPSGLAVDAAGIVYIADTLNGAIRRLDLATGNLTTLSSDFSRPGAVAVGPGGVLFVADSATHSIYRLTGSIKTLLAGGNSTFAAGFKDSGDATRALFNSPRGLLYKSSGELLVADSGNGLIRRIVDADTAAPVVTTVQIVSDKLTLISPVAMAYDKDDVLVVADRADNALKGFLPPQSNLKQVAIPVFGTVDFPLNGCGATLSALPTATFINDPILAIGTELGSSTYFTYGDVLDAADLADPTPSSLTPPAYVECQPRAPINLLAALPKRTGHMVIKAISTQINRRASAVATAIYIFRCANPVVNGSNPVRFGLSSDTINSSLWYTFGPPDTDFPDPNPTNSASRLYTPNSLLNIYSGTNVSIKVRAFRDGYQPSAVTRQDFTIVDAQINAIGFTRDFKGAPGAMLVLPVELQPAPSNTVQSIQFRVEIKPASGSVGVHATPALGTLAVRSDSFILITPAGFDNPQGIYYSNGVTNGVGLAFLSSGGNSHTLTSTSVVSMLSVRVPKSASDGDRYEISVVQASATSDGINTDVAITNLPTRLLTVSTNLSYLVGDSASASWYNSGEFGDGDLKNDDVNGVFLATLGFRAPYPGSDAFDAMDTFPLDTVEAPGGDAQLRYLDFQVVLLRSLRLDLGNWKRLRDPKGERMAVRLGEMPAANLQRGGRVTAQASAYPRAWTRPARIEARTLQGVTQTVPTMVPVYVVLQPGTTASGLQFVARVVAPVGSPAIGSFSFVPADGIPPADRAGSEEAASLFVSWNLGSFAPSLSGSTLLGYLRFNVPGGALTRTAYSVEIDHADGAPDIRTSIDWETLPGKVWVNSAAQQPDNPLPPEWRDHFYGSVLADTVLPSADSDGDGASNYTEYLAGTDPTRSDLKLSVTSESDRTSHITWFGHSTVKYSLQSASNPSGPWQTMATPANGNNDWMTVIQQASETGDSQFFRISAIPQN